MTTCVTVATDGSAINNPRGPAGWAWFVSERCWAAGAFPQASNQVAELTAILQALRMIPAEFGLHVRTDSQFAINVLSTWMRGWKRPDGTWRKGDGKEPENLALIKALDAAMAGRTVRFEKVKGHSGDPMNEIADRICTAASGAQQAGTRIMTGPGWTGYEAAPVVPAVRASTTARRAAPSPTAGPARSRTRARATTARTAPRATGTRERLITGVNDVEDKRVLPTSTEARRETVLCGSCNTPIHPLTHECRCSFTGG